jgi:plasmid maintenance system antidote protein VapI
MARGWESKSVEEQMANATDQKPPRPGEVLMTEAERRVAADQRAVNERRKQALNLQRENILSQRTSNPARRAALTAALAEIEAQISALE